MKNQFKETLIRFTEFIAYDKHDPYTWEAWVELDNPDAQVAVLYCQFYDQITLAWYKAKADFTPDEDGLSCVLQYLFKNVPIIANNKNKFTPKYIYRVAYNCMDCIRYIQRDINRYKLETTNIAYKDDEELDLCDLVPAQVDFIEEFTSEEFWDVIKDMGVETEKVVNHLLNGESLRRVPKRSKSYATDPLANVGVNAQQFEQILAALKIKLSKFRQIYCV